MYRRQPLAGFVEELAHQQRVGLQPVGARQALLIELRLNLGEGLGVDDRGMLARPGPAAMVDLAKKMPIAQKSIERAAGEGNAAHDLAGAELADPAANVAPPQLS